MGSVAESDLRQLEARMRDGIADAFEIDPVRLEVRATWTLDDPEKPEGGGRLLVQTDLDGKTPPADMNAVIAETWAFLAAFALGLGIPISFQHGTTEEGGAS